MDGASWYSETPEGTVLNVKAQTRSSRCGVDGVVDGAVKVRVKAAPVDGKANREITETLADFLGLAKSRVEFRSGETSRNKRILVKGVGAAALKGIIGA